MELWHAWTCPYSQRVRIALAEKGLSVEEHVVDLASKPPALLALNPAGGVPVLVVDGAAIPDSSVILQYLEDLATGPALLPTDALGRARTRLLYDRITAGLGPHLPRLLRGSDEEKTRAGLAVVTTLTALEQEVAEDGFLAGPYSIADIALAPFVAKLPPSLRPLALGLRRLARWEALVLSRPAVAAVVGGRSAAA
jgi:RNA polymerase-associated protein